MADPANLPPEEKVRILTAKPDLTPEEANRYADLFLDAGKYAQTMMFLERSRDPERLARVKREAIKMGDAFLLHAVVKLQPELVDEEEWRQAGEQAHKDGRFHFARECYTRAGDADRAEEIRQEWLKTFPAQETPAAETPDEPPTSSPGEPDPTRN